jgi:hypothetical protein
MGNCFDESKERHTLAKAITDVHRTVSCNTNNPAIEAQADIQLITGVASVTNLDYPLPTAYSIAKDVIQNLTNYTKRSDYIILQTAIVHEMGQVETKRERAVADFVAFYKLMDNGAEHKDKVFNEWYVALETTPEENIDQTLASAKCAVFDMAKDQEKQLFAKKTMPPGGKP